MSAISAKHRIGVVSDTHGLLRPQAVALLQGCDLILHGGDIGTIEVLAGLKQIAPVVAVRGNVDHGETAKLPAFEAVEFAGHSFYLLHNLAALDLEPKVAGFSAVIYGHTHQPHVMQRHGVWYFNPGSIGPRRFSLPISMGFIDIMGDTLTTRHVEIA
jgi:hypothetical protein